MFSQSSLQTTPADLVAAELRATGYADAAGSPLLELGAASVVASFSGSIGDARLFNAGYDELRAYFDQFAEHYAALARQAGVARSLSAAAARLGASIPGDSVDSQFSRIVDPAFWARVYMKRTQRAREFALVKSGFVAKRRELYVSDASLKLFRETKARQAAYLENQYIVDRRLNEKGEHSRFSLAAAAASAAESRAAERWAFIKGIEQLSVEAGLDCALLTLTLEETYHANPTTPGAAYDGVSTPADCRAELSRRWHKIERDLHNRGIALSGARFLEPHGDATPHWHLWVHYDPSQLVLILDVIGRYFPRGIRVRSVEESADGELKSKKNGKRFTQRYAYFDADALAIVPASKFVATRRGRGVDLSVINRAYANGATYAAKYSLKTFTPGEASERVAASRWVWGGRSFQFFGIKRCLTLWRSLYRSSDVPTDPHAAALYRVVHAEPGKHTVHRRDPATGDVIEFEQEGGTAPFLRLLGGLAAAGRRASTVGYRSMYATFPGRYGDASRRHTGYVLYNEDGEVVHTLNTKEPGRYVRCSVSLDSTASGAERLRATASKLSAFTATLSSPDLPARRIINPATASLHFEYMFVGPRQPS